MEGSYHISPGSAGEAAPQMQLLFRVPLFLPALKGCAETGRGLSEGY